LTRRLDLLVGWFHLDGKHLLAAPPGEACKQCYYDRVQDKGIRERTCPSDNEARSGFYQEKLSLQSNYLDRKFIGVLSPMENVGDIYRQHVYS
jgi:hypothetical protein